MNTDIIRITQALDFAAKKHVHQRRKGKFKEPYINHLAEVANLLSEATQGREPDLVIAGLLHDSIEDQKVTREEISELFGECVACLVEEVTDDKSLGKQKRKRLQAETASLKSPQARLIKIADKTSNLRSLLHSPPARWDENRIHRYFSWAKSVVDGCRGINPWLEEQFDAAFACEGEIKNHGLVMMMAPADF